MNQAQIEAVAQANAYLNNAGLGQIGYPGDIGYKPVLQINAKSVYGKTLYYPGNQAAELIAKIAGAKTLSPAQISYAEQLGFSINYNVVL